MNCIYTKEESKSFIDYWKQCSNTHVAMLSVLLLKRTLHGGGYLMHHRYCTTSLSVYIWCFSLVAMKTVLWQRSLLSTSRVSLNIKQSVFTLSLSLSLSFSLTNQWEKGMVSEWERERKVLESSLKNTEISGSKFLRISCIPARGAYLLDRTQLEWLPE